MLRIPLLLRSEVPLWYVLQPWRQGCGRQILRKTRLQRPSDGHGNRRKQRQRLVWRHKRSQVACQQLCEIWFYNSLSKGQGGLHRLSVRALAYKICRHAFSTKHNQQRTFSWRILRDNFAIQGLTYGSDRCSRASVGSGLLLFSLLAYHLKSCISTWSVLYYI